ncbi:TPA: acyltransferase [Clostridium perfringens]|nr:acyltransferase [Clostridium perfringens]
MSKGKAFFSKIISNIKGEEFSLDDDISICFLLSESISRILMIFRGIFKFASVKKYGIVFCDKNVIVKCKKKIKLGRNNTFKRYVELNAFSKKGIQIGDNASIGAYSIIRCSGGIKSIGKGIKIGNNFGCGDYCFFGAAGGIEIGDDVIMGQNVRFHSENHNYIDKNKLIRLQGISNKGIKIESDCWIGAGTVFLDGVTIGKGCVIGANSVVTKDIEEYSVVCGNPARIIKKRR